MRLVAVLLPALVALAGCAPERAQQEVAAVVTPAVEQAQVSIAEAITPAILALQEAAQGAVEPLPLSERPFTTWAGAPAATALIVRWEVTSPKAYTRLYQGVICPGGASGPTIGIGYDLGHQTRSTIAREWAGHPDVARLMDGSGRAGDNRCNAYRATHRDIRVPYAMASAVFKASTLPAYHVAARRALSSGWNGITPNAQAANTSLGYNRGWSMSGERNREKRAIRDECVPAYDTPCNAAQLRAMCRIWAGTPNGKGLCARRNDEAKLTVTP